ncbi:MAG: hypothetical protein HXY43_15575 [Fischerella sp.]|jgi:hypothetical protein|uniref:hypothetical protein n=1 Tax=Fischerella sp. TaxID=1191 RepID=UPI0017C5175B|nr:hypothetical protein [Fischerella sp.]NWF60632.1 hypothetical protein [Fischerella sp.]
MPKKRGNPKITEHGIPAKENPMRKTLCIKVTELMFEKIKSIDNYSEFCRQALQEALDRLEQSQS